jgi:hypothetical protein
MSWFKVDDGFLTHPKVFGIKAGPLALWLRAGLWCAKELTDGVMSARAVKALEAKPAHIQELVERGLWEPYGDGFRIHNFLKYQPSRAQVLKTRNETLQRVRKHRNAVTNADVTPAPGPGPVPISSVNQVAENDVSVRLTPTAILASKGRQRLRAIDELQLDFDHGGKHAHALSVIAQLPAKTWAAAAAVLKAELEKGNRKFITPQSIVDNWRDYSEGRAPGQRKPVASAKPQPVEAPRYAYRDAAGGE